MAVQCHSVSILSAMWGMWSQSCVSFITTCDRLSWQRFPTWQERSMLENPMVPSMYESCKCDELWLIKALGQTRSRNWYPQTHHPQDEYALRNLHTNQELGTPAPKSTYWTTKALQHGWNAREYPLPLFADPSTALGRRQSLDGLSCGLHHSTWTSTTTRLTQCKRSCISQQSHESAALSTTCSHLMTTINRQHAAWAATISCQQQSPCVAWHYDKRQGNIRLHVRFAMISIRRLGSLMFTAKHFTGHDIENLINTNNKAELDTTRQSAFDSAPGNGIERSRIHVIACCFCVCPKQGRHRAVAARRLRRSLNCWANVPDPGREHVTVALQACFAADACAVFETCGFVGVYAFGSSCPWLVPLWFVPLQLVPLRLVFDPVENICWNASYRANSVLNSRL